MVHEVLGVNLFWQLVAIAIIALFVWAMAGIVQTPY